MALEPVLSTVRDGSDGKESACSEEDPGSISGSGRSPGERNGYPFQYTCLENPTDRDSSWGRRIGHNQGTNTLTSHLKAKGERGHANIKVVSLNFEGHHIHLKQWFSIGSTFNPSRDS